MRRTNARATRLDSQDIVDGLEASPLEGRQEGGADPRDIAQIETAHELRFVAWRDDVHTSGLRQIGRELRNDSTRPSSDGHGDFRTVQDGLPDPACGALQGLRREHSLRAREVEVEFVDRGRL